MADKQIQGGGSGVPEVLADISNGAGTLFAPGYTLYGPNGKPIQGDALGNLLASLATLLAGEDRTANRLLVEQRNNPTHLSATTAGTLLKPGAGLLHRVVANAPVATAALTIYDGLSAAGAVIAAITISASPQPFSLAFDVQFTTGLFVVLATAAGDWTLTWR